MNMEMYVSGDFDQQARVHNFTIIHPQRLKFWECDLQCNHFAWREREREREMLADCLCVAVAECGGYWSKLRATGGDLRGLLCYALVSAFVLLSLCAHSLCTCCHTGRNFVDVHLYPCPGSCASVYVGLLLCISASICFCICPHCISCAYDSRSRMITKAYVVWTKWRLKILQQLLL